MRKLWPLVLVWNILLVLVGAYVWSWVRDRYSGRGPIPYSAAGILHNTLRGLVHPVRRTLEQSHVGPGTTVRFENRGRTWHNVFSISPTKPFDVGKYAPRQSREVVFDRPGVVPLLCELDPDESGFVFVAPNHAFARPDRAGAFVLAGIPGGEYRLVVWHPGFGRLERDVTVPRRGGVTVALRL